MVRLRLGLRCLRASMAQLRARLLGLPRLKKVRTSPLPMVILRRLPLLRRVRLKTCKVKVPQLLLSKSK